MKKPEITRKDVLVTPKLAEQWLNQNTDNRNLRPGVVEKYASDMANGRWTSCPMPISFGHDGVLVDGQHRLWAIIESGKGQWFTIARGFTREDALNIDTGLGRSFVDNVQRSGVVGLTSNIMAAVRWMEWGRSSVTPTPSSAVLREVGLEHKEAASFAVNRVHGKGLSKGAVCGAVMRAWYTEDDKELLARFCHVYSTGFANGDRESAAVCLRNTALNMASSGMTSGEAMRELFLKTQHCIKQFMSGRKLTVLRSVNEETYPYKRKKAKET